MFKSTFEFYEWVDGFVEELKSKKIPYWPEKILLAVRGGSTSGEILGRVRTVLYELTYADNVDLDKRVLYQVLNYLDQALGS